MKKFILAIPIISFFLSGCLSLAWTNFKKPAAKDFESAGKNGLYISIGKQNLDQRQWQAVKEATTEVCGIFADKEFKLRVASKVWLASCERKHGEPDTINGAEVNRLLSGKPIKYSMQPHKPWNADGQTETDENNTENNRVAIDPKFIEDWYAVSDSLRSGLIDIIAHETMHVVSERFLDYDTRARSSCPDSLLVSYGIGNLVRELWLKQKKKSQL